jgi:hypothetical protein
MAFGTVKRRRREKRGEMVKRQGAEGGERKEEERESCHGKLCQNLSLEIQCGN